MSEVEKKAALANITSLIDEFELTKEDLLACLQEAGAKVSKKHGISTLFQYLGGRLLFSAIGVFVGIYWNSLSDTFRVLLTLGSGLIFYTLAWVYTSPRLSTVLFLLAAPLEPT